ncbi:MAG: hypothetical protein KA807_18195 [Prolixibacteraceae bacterium]|nr:hypothetical protein [Prolixibacteraceae bacterium]
MNKKVLFIGLTTVDIQHFVTVFPSPNQKIKTEPPHVYVGGPAANAAVTFSFLGGEADFISCVGCNPFTDFIVDDIKRNGVKLIDFRSRNNFSPVISSVLTTLNSNDRSIVSHLPEKIIINDEDIGSVNLDEYEIVFSDGFYPEISIPICKKAKEKGISVVYDGGSWKPGAEEILKNVDFAICSENFYPPGYDKSEDVLKFLKGSGIKNSAITRGENSIIFYENDYSDTIEIEQVNTKDSLGAGDIFHGAFIWYLKNGNDFRDSLVKASKIATYSTKHKGTRSWMNTFSDKSFI